MTRARIGAAKLGIYLAIFPGLVMVPAEMVKLALLVSKTVGIEVLATLTFARVAAGPVTGQEYVPVLAMPPRGVITCHEVPPFLEA